MKFANKKNDVISMGLALGHITMVIKTSKKIPDSMNKTSTTHTKWPLNFKEQLVCDSATD